MIIAIMINASVIDAKRNMYNTFDSMGFLVLVPTFMVWITQVNAMDTTLGSYAMRRMRDLESFPYMAK